jgi:hypothetical protein
VLTGEDLRRRGLGTLQPNVRRRRRNGHFGRRMAVTISSALSAVISGPLKKSAAAIARVPALPVTAISASQVTAMPGSSAAGSACARLPPTVPRLRI